METERLRISRELHDIILPQVRGQPVSDQIRTICMELMPPDFSKLSLKDSLADVCDKFSKRTGIECACSIEDELKFEQVSAENQLHIYRMVQEAFTNIEKHSKANKVSLVARRDKQGDLERILICVSDDGIGLGHDTAAVKSSEEGLGIKSMRQRAEIIGAKIDFISESGNGLMVRIEVAGSREQGAG